MSKKTKEDFFRDVHQIFLNHAFKGAKAILKEKKVCKKKESITVLITEYKKRIYFKFSKGEIPFRAYNSTPKSLLKILERNEKNV
jgi:hypothetical protein